MLLCLVACGDDDSVADTGTPDATDDTSVDVSPEDTGTLDSGVVDHPAADAPLSTVTTEGVRRELFFVDGSTPAENPVAGVGTPPELNRTQVVRYRQDVEPAIEPRAILIGMPGFLGGGPSYEGLARDMVLRGAASGEALEVWMIDRRSNQLEDLRGMHAAEAADDPEIANGYYFGSDTVGGQAFDGFLPQDELLFESEWGLATHVEDLHAVVSLIDEAQRRGHVFLLGHSLGAMFAELYAAWRFEDGSRPIDELAGIVLLDGLLAPTPITESEYENGAEGLIPSPGLNAVRTTEPFTELPLLGVGVVARAEIMAMRTLLAPDEVRVDGSRDRTLGLLMGLSPAAVPALSNAAAFSLPFDDEFSALGFLKTKLGTLVGGPIETYTSLLAMAESRRPSDPDVTYTWEDNELTSVEVFAEAFSHGATNYAEWYFPSRLRLDINAAGGANLAEDSWQANYGIRAFDGALNDAPILCVPAELFGPATNCEGVRSRVAAEIGEGRPHAGVTRDDELGFRIIDATDLAHLDPTMARDSEDNPVPAAVERFVMEHASEGLVSFTVPE